MMRSSLKLLADISKWFSVLSPTNGHPTHVDAASSLPHVKQVKHSFGKSYMAFSLL